MAESKKHTAGALDIRNVIGALLLVYGVILLVTRFVAGDEGGANSEGVNANLWAGIALLVVGGAFVLWSRLRPVVVPENVASPEDLPPPSER
ncbi:hypothetical protein [Nocardioides sp.]|uniref:hypothetical protein n=1 Tax=Nocardioides sp. TaxID=35761 RepID=UPI002720EF9E|nr:hypothetical protein [Nocardioides sp.]MDO9454677.1 hypothetical protein [Nocardioides sp.]